MTLRKLVRYGLKGLGFVGLNIAVQMALVELGGLRPAVAAAVSTACMPFLGYVAMNRFVFPDAGAAETRRGYVTRFGKYYATNLSSKAANYGIFLALLYVGVWYPVAYAVGAGVVFLGTFSLNNYFWHGELA